MTAKTPHRPRPFKPSLSLRWRIALPALVWVVSCVPLALWVLQDPTSQARVWVAVFGAGIGGLLVTLLAGGWVVRRADRLTDTARQLSAGHHVARAPQSPADELGAAGAALNTYADYAQAKLDTLRAHVRARRHDIAQLTSALLSLPEGVVVLDMAGQVVVMNPPARALLGASQSATDLTALTATVTDQLGETLAPGVYALGDPLRVDVGERIVQSQVAAVMTGEDIRLGTVILLRDLTSAARQDRARAALLDQLDDVIEVLPPDYAQPLRAWAKRMHDLTTADDQNVLREDSTFAVESLVWAVANEWRRIAEDHHIELQVDIKVRGLSIHGDAKRLSWALGALVDNAIKYTPVGGLLMIQVRPPEGDQVVIRVRDNGVGIKREELPQVFGRFFRGTPETPDGRPLRVPGMGQGLTLAKQIVEAHGGEIVVKSRPGSGTAVYVHLPTAEA